MTIRFACRCGKKMKTSDDKIGKKVLCSSCGSPVVVPSSDTVAVEKVAAPIAAADSASKLLRGAAASVANTAKGANGTKQKEKPRRTLAYDDSIIEGEGSYDTAATARYVTMTFVLPVGIVLLFCATVYGITAWISKKDPKHPVLADVYGTLTLDGEPLNGARIILRPKTEGSESRGSASVGRSGKDGKYRMEYARDASGDPVYGVPLGECTVQISATDGTGREVAPTRFRDRSETRTVEKGSNTFEFQLKSASQ